MQLIGAVANLAPEYASAGMLVVPLRAGSGTRIKILEAFQHRTPVVSTTKGAEGLAVTNGEHLLIADTPEEFAAACLRLSTDDDLCRRLTERAHAWVVQHHSIDTVRKILCKCLGNVTPC
jgi:glycosyltransferase involved in cell wall biosynthesis